MIFSGRVWLKVRTSSVFQLVHAVPAAKKNAAGNVLLACLRGEGHRAPGLAFRLNGKLVIVLRANRFRVCRLGGAQ